MYTVIGCVPFDLLVDIDVGLFKFIQQNFNNPNIFYESLLKERDVGFMKHVLLERERKNPLYCLMREDTKFIEEADSLYDQFMEQHYDEIIDLSVTTGIFDIVRRSTSVNDVVRFDIICRTEHEKEFLLMKFKKFKVRPSIIMVKSYDELDMKYYGSVYIKDIHDIFLYPKFHTKNIIIGNYKFNFEKSKPGLPLIEVAEKILQDNPIQIIDIHAINKNKYVG